MVDPPASLTVVCVSKPEAGRGMFDAGLLLKAGRLPRPWPRLGVPLMVPLEAILTAAYASFYGSDDKVSADCLGEDLRIGRETVFRYGNRKLLLAQARLC